VSTLRQSAWQGRPTFSLHDQQSALMSLSAIADRVQLSPSSSSAAASAAAAMISSSFVYGTQSSVSDYPASIQVREVARTLKQDSRLPGVEVLGPS